MTLTRFIRVSRACWPRTLSTVPLPRRKQDIQLENAANWAHNILVPYPEPSNTIRILNVPPATSLKDVLDLVLFGPIYGVDKFRNSSSCSVSITFFDITTADAFFREITSYEVFLRGEKLRFAWGRTETISDTSRTRAIFISDVQPLGSFLKMRERLSRYGHLDRISFTDNRSSAYVDFAHVISAIRAVSELSAEGMEVRQTDDRCWTAGNIYRAALKSRTRRVSFSNIPPDTTHDSLYTFIRGGALEKIEFVSGDNTALIHFITHEGAVAFYRYALYHGITLGSKRLRAEMNTEPECVALTEHLAQSVAHGATRRLHVQQVPDRLAAKLLAELRRFPSVSLGIDRGSVRATFTDIQHAVDVSRLVASDPEYAELQVEFDQDPCAASPFSDSFKKSRSLQAHIDSFVKRRAEAG